MDLVHALRASWRKGPGMQGERGSKGSWHLSRYLSMLMCSHFAPLGWTPKSCQANVLPTDKPAGHRPRELAWSQVSLTSEPRHTQGASKEADMRTPYPEPCPALNHPGHSPTRSLFQFPRALHCPGLLPPHGCSFLSPLVDEVPADSRRWKSKKLFCVARETEPSGHPHTSTLNTKFGTACCPPPPVHP